MNTPTKLAAAMATVLLTAPVYGAPKKPDPVPATEQQPTPKKSLFGKLKSSLGFTKKEEVPAPAVVKAPAPKAAKTKDKPAPPESVKPAPKTAAPIPAKKGAEPPAKKAGNRAVPSTEKIVKGKKTVPAPEVAATPTPEKKGFFKKLFGGKTQAGAPPAGPALATVKTAKPSPVKEVKGGKPAARVAAAPAVEEPKKKGGFFSFLRRGHSGEESAKVPDSAKMPRPDDWQDHRVVKEDGLALYEFGPSQSNGPDDRLDTGAVVKVKKMERGWALVQVNGGRAGYVDASALRNAEEGDFAAPPVRAVATTASLSPESWAPAAPPPDLPDHPAALDGESGILLLPPLELEPKKH